MWPARPQPDRCLIIVADTILDEILHLRRTTLGKPPKGEHHTTKYRDREKDLLGPPMRRCQNLCDASIVAPRRSR